MDPKLSGLCELARSYQSLRDDYERAARLYLADIDLSLAKFSTADAEFWAFIEKVKGNLPLHNWNSKTALDESVRSYLFDHRHRVCCCPCHEEATRGEAEKQPTELDRWQKLAVFCAMYTKYVGEISKKIGRMEGLERSDDGFSDLIDSLPLAGKYIVERLLIGTIKTYKGLKDEMPGTGNTTGQLTQTSRFILEGENYIHAHFTEALTRYLGTVAVFCHE
jgi:hypothetical protein